jgi:hypothetical protein
MDQAWTDEEQEALVGRFNLLLTSEAWDDLGSFVLSSRQGKLL